MEETNETTPTTEANNKIASGREHAQKALNAAGEAGKTVGETVKAQADHLVKVGKEHLGAAVKDLSDAANAKYSEFRDQANKKAGECRTKVQTYQTEVESYVRQKPLQSLGIAAAVGFLLGLILRR